LVSADESFRNRVLAAIRQPDAQARLVLDLPSFADRVTSIDLGRVVQASPKVAFLDLGKGPAGVEGIRAFGHEAPEVALIVAGPELSAEGLLAVMRAGAAEYLPRPFSPGDVEEAFLRVRRRAKLVQAETPTPPGRVTTVFSAKGGTGVTTVATNLAVALRQSTGRETLLVDLVPTLGTAAVALGLEPRYTYVDLIQNFHRVDEELFRSFLATHESGVQVLASPGSPGEPALLSGDELSGLIRLCQRHFDFVVIDGGCALSVQLLTVLHDSDERLLVVTPELPALRNLKRALPLFGRTNGKAPFRLILNQYREGVGLTPRDVETGLGHRVAAVLEREEMSVLESINVGRPEVLSGKSRFARSVMSLSRELAGSEVLPKVRKGVFGRFFKAAATAKGQEKDKEKK
jgi:pilus assembly protein CpaE